MPPQISPARVVKGIELSHKSKRYKYFIPKESGHNYVYIDPIEGVKMDSPQAKLRLSGDTDVELRNCAGSYQTFIKKKDKEEFDRVLVSVYTKVHDGDRLIFGTPSDLSVEFQVKVLYDVLKETSQQLKASKALEKAQSDKSTKTKDPPVQNKKSPSDKKDVQAKKPPLRKTRSADNMNLKPPADDKKVKRKSDGNLQQKQKTQEQNEKKKKTHNLSLPQILDDIKECSSSTQLGDGYNALTRAFTGHCALAARTPDKSAKELPLEDFNSDVFVLSATSSVLSADEVGFGTGARISTDVSLRAKYDELASMQWDVSKVFVKYVRDGKYGWQPIKSAVRYRRGVDIQNPSFWTEYGDYYVSDVQRWFGCCVVMVFHIEHLSDIDQAQTDIEARLRDIFEARAHSSTKLIEDMRWSMHRVFCSCYGYSQDILSQSMGLSNLSDVLKFLDKINSIVPPGVARRVKLTRYLDLSPEITIPKSTYNDILGLHKLSAQLSEKSLNPAIRRNTDLLKQIESVISSFRSNSVNFFDRNRQGDGNEYQKIRMEMRKRLDDTGKKANLAINRSGLIFEAQRLLKKGAQLDTPRDKQKGKVWRWRCGMTGTFKERGKIASEAAYTISRGDFTPQCPNYRTPSQDVYMAAWNFTVLKRSMLWSSTTNVVCRQDTDRASAHYSFDKDTSQLLLHGDQPIHIIGWTVKCEYVDERGLLPKKTDGQSLKVRLEPQMNGQGNSELSDYFHVTVKSTDRIKCTVQMFFVYQSVFSDRH